MAQVFRIDQQVALKMVVTAIAIAAATKGVVVAAAATSKTATLAATKGVVAKAACTVKGAGATQAITVAKANIVAAKTQLATAKHTTSTAASNFFHENGNLATLSHDYHRPNGSHLWNALQEASKRRQEAYDVYVQAQLNQQVAEKTLELVAAKLAVAQGVMPTTSCWAGLGKFLCA